MQVHDSTQNENPVHAESEHFEDAYQDQDEDSDGTLLIQAAAQKTKIAPSDIRRVLSSKGSKNATKPNLRIDTLVHEMISCLESSQFH